MKAEFLGSRLIDRGLGRLSGRTGGQVCLEGVSRGAEHIEKAPGRLAGGAELAVFGDDDRPTEDGSDEKCQQDGLSGHVGMFKGEENSDGCQHGTGIRPGGGTSTAGEGMFPFSVKNLGTGVLCEFKMKFKFK